MEPVTRLEGPVAASFFIAIVVIGKYLLVNLLVAVILTEFGDSTAETVAISSFEDDDDAGGGGGSPSMKRRKSMARRKSTAPPTSAADGLGPRPASPNLADDALATADPFAGMESRSINPMWSHELMKTPGSSSEACTVTAMVRIDGEVQTNGQLAAFQMGELCGLAAHPQRVPFGVFKGQMQFAIQVFHASFASLDSPPVYFRFWSGFELIDLSPSLTIEASAEGTMFEPIVLAGRSYIPAWPTDYSLLCFSRRSWLRRKCVQLASNESFANAVLVVIVLSSVTLALDTPRLDPSSPLALLLRRADLLFTLIFFVEMLVKVVASGFYFARDAYIRNPWNLIDFAIVMVSIIVRSPLTPTPNPNPQPKPIIVCTRATRQLQTR